MAGKARKKKRRKRIRVRLPLARKPGRAMGTPKGRKGYDRKRQRKEIERETEDL